MTPFDPAAEPMLRLPQKQSLEKQTVAVLRELIVAGTWGEWLPGERLLCDQLQVSRYTLRAALEALRKEGVVASEMGVGNRIVARANGRAGMRTESREVGLLLAGELDVLLPTQVMWIDQLRAMLAEREVRLHIFHGLQFAQRDPSGALQKLVARHRHGCWILLLAPQVVQAWFQKAGVPCVVAGSLYSGVTMPCCDVDHRAMCRHAAGIFLGRGHKTLALIVEKTQKAGDVESEAGFVEAIRQAAADVALGYHDATPAGIASSVKRIMLRTPTPTAMLVVNPFHFLAAISALTRLGRRIPEDVSVISRDGEPFLSYLQPTPAHYAANPRIFAKTLLMHVLRLLTGDMADKRVSLIMPEFFPGQSVSTVT